MIYFVYAGLNDFFSQVHSNLNEIFSRYLVKYYINFNLNRVGISEVTATITDSKGNNLLNYQHSDYDLEHLESDNKFNGLSDLQQRKIKGLLEEANPKKISLLTTSEPCLIDGHGKNFSLFLEQENRYRLMPFYDMMSAYPLIKHNKLQMGNSVARRK